MDKLYIEEPKKPELFHSSGEYWEKRYANGGNSGSGSYNRLAEFKAEVVNSFMKEHGINSCIEWGCGDGNQLSMMEYKKYLGLDVSKEIIKQDLEKFKDDNTKRFMPIDHHMQIKERFDMSVSLDVIYHLVEDEVFETYMKNLFSYADKFVCIYSSNENSKQCGYYNHMRHRKFSDYIDNHFKDWKLYRFVENRYPFDINHSSETSFSDFYFYKKRTFFEKIGQLFQTKQK